MANQAYGPWTVLKDYKLLRDYLTWGPKGKRLAKS
jgi:hypothetical protein